jgi:hypothetical protein
MDAWVWILLLLIVIGVIVGVMITRSRQRESRRLEAAELRDPTADHQMELREKEAAAAASEAEARRVKAEADQRAAEAQQLEITAQRASAERDRAAAASAEQLRRADALDPDVRTDKDGNRLAEDGEPVETPVEAPAAEQAVTGFGASSAARDHADADHADHGHEHTHAYEGNASGGRIGNMRGLDEDDHAVAEPDRGSSDEARAEHGQPLHRIGNMRGVDEDQTRVTPVTPETPERVGTTSDATSETTGETTHETTDETVADGEPDARDRARQRADDVLARRDAEAERRQPE